MGQNIKPLIYHLFPFDLLSLLWTFFVFLSTHNPRVKNPMEVLRTRDRDPNFTKNKTDPEQNMTLSVSVSDPDPNIFRPLDPDPQVKKNS